MLALTIAACAQRDRGPDLAGLWYNTNQDCPHVGYMTMEFRSDGSIRLQERTGLIVMHMADQRRPRNLSCADDVDQTTEALNGEWKLDRDRLR